MSARNLGPLGFRAHPALTPGDAAGTVPMPVDDGAIGSRDERIVQGAVELVAPDLARAVAFYARLGFAEVRRTEDFAALHFADVLLLTAEDAGATITPC